MNTSVAQLRLSRAIPVSPSAPASERLVRRRVGLAWGLLVLNALTYYGSALHIPHVVGRVITQAALPAALIVALTVNRKVIIRPNVFLSLVSLLVVEAIITCLQPQHLGTVYRTFRLGEFVAALWLISPWWGRRDLLLVRYHLTALSVVLGSVVLGLLVMPGRAISGKRLQGVLWDIPATQVAHYAAVMFGLVVVLWLSGYLPGRRTLVVVAVTGVILLLTHTRTALVGLTVGIVFAGLSLITVKARARKFFAGAGVMVAITIMTLSSYISNWLTRGQDTSQLHNLTGRTEVWGPLLAFPRNKFEVIFGFGLSNSSSPVNGLPIDSNWLASYQEQGLVGVIICAAILLFLLVAAYFHPHRAQRALAIFLVTYCIVASFTEVGFTDVSMYLLDLTVAASLIVSSSAARDPTRVLPAVPHLSLSRPSRGRHLERPDNAFGGSGEMISASGAGGRVDGRLVACCAVAVIVCAGLTACGLGSQRPPAVGPAALAMGPASPPARICGNKAILGGGPAVPPKGAVIIPAGDDSSTVLAHNWTMRADTTYWFAPGRHTLGTGQFGQIIPSNGDTFIGAPGAILDGQHKNLYAFTEQARNVTIRYLTIQNFGGPADNHDQGVVNHDEGPGWHIDHITVQDSAGAGVMLGSGNVLAYSCLRDNGQYGFQGFDSHITVDHDEIVGNNTDDWEVRRPGCGCTGGAKFWGVNGAIITSNYVHDNVGPGLWADTNNRGFDVEHNYFADNQAEGFIYEISYNLRLADNTFVRNALVAGPKLGGFPDSAVYISASGADSRIPGPYGNTLSITGNTFTDNWGGVVLYENADRHCGSGSNSSTGDCTLVNPSVATVSKCGDASLIGTKPYYNDCRWKTQNVLVSQNVFTFDPARIGPECTPAKYCGFNGIFSDGGSWAPYQGPVVEYHITFDQNNHFVSNSYYGPWEFVLQDQGNVVSWSTWRGSPYDQDAHSTMDGASA